VTYWILLTISLLLWAFCALLQFLDVVTTNQFLKQKKSDEGNPLMADVQKLAGGYRGPWWIVKIVLMLALLSLIWYVAHIYDDSLIMSRLQFVALILGLFAVNVYYVDVVRTNDETDKGVPHEH
jgi:hypothetical protein